MHNHVSSPNVFIPSRPAAEKMVEQGTLKGSQKGSASAMHLASEWPQFCVVRMDVPMPCVLVEP